MPRYWITTHFPPVPGGRDTFHVYLKDSSDAPGMAAGDRIFIYECTTGPKLLIDGQIVTRTRGKGGVICEAEVTSNVQQRPETEPRETYESGSDSWEWIARTGNRNCGYAAREDLNAVLGYKPHNRLQGFNAGRGIKELTHAQYTELLRKFNEAGKGELRTLDRTRSS